MTTRVLPPASQVALPLHLAPSLQGLRSPKLVGRSSVGLSQEEGRESLCQAASAKLNPRCEESGNVEHGAGEGQGTSGPFLKPVF